MNPQTKTEITEIDGQRVEFSPDPGADKPRRETTREIVLDGKGYTIKRMRTRDGLAVAKTILTYISKLGDQIEAISEVAGTDAKREDTVKVGMQMIEAIMPLLDEDELIGVAARITGIDPAVLDQAPIEDTMNAIADAFEINDMPALINAAQRIWSGLQRFAGGR